MVKKKSELKIGDEVFFVDKENVSSSIIKSISHNEKGTSCRLDDNKYKDYNLEDLFKSEGEAEYKLKQIQKKYKYSFNDIVVVKRKNHIQIGKIVERYISNEGNLFYNLAILDNFGCSSIEFSFKEEELTKVDDKYIINFGRVKEIVKELEEFNKKKSEIVKRLNREYEILDDELKIGYRKINSWVAKVGLIDIQEYKDRFFIPDDEDEDY